MAVIVPTLAQSISGDKWVFSSPSRSIDEIDFDSSGVMWTKPSQAGITSLNPATDAVTNWTHENSTIFGTNFGMVAVQQVEADIDRHIWSTFENGDHVNRLNTATGEVVSWPLPSSTTFARAFRWGPAAMSTTNVSDYSFERHATFRNNAGEEFQISVCLGLRCADMNCDGLVNGADIDPFFEALGDPAAWQAAHPNCPLLCVGDVNFDGRFDGGDIDMFICLLALCHCPP